MFTKYTQLIDMFWLYWYVIWLLCYLCTPVICHVWFSYSDIQSLFLYTYLCVLTVFYYCYLPKLCDSTDLAQVLVMCCVLTLQEYTKCSWAWCSAEADHCGVLQWPISLSILSYLTSLSSKHKNRCSLLLVFLVSLFCLSLYPA